MDGKSHAPFGLAAIPMAILTWVIFWAQDNFTWGAACVAVTDPSFNLALFCITLFWLVIDYSFANRSTRLYLGATALIALLLAFSLTVLSNYYLSPAPIDVRGTIIGVDQFSNPGVEKSVTVSLMAVRIQGTVYYYKVRGTGYAAGAPANVRLAPGLLFSYLVEVVPTSDQ